jgi:regulator of protease activity HflC (stomatin/prohibitin superfamily)
MDDEIKFYQKPAARAVIVFAAFVVGYFFWELISRWFYPEDLNPAFDITWDFLLCGGGLVFWLVFFAQFCLPVTTVTQRIKIIDRLFNYLLGSHGPAIFISNGIVREKTGERLLKGPGVMWLDSSSAAMLGTSLKFTRTIGPGVHFINSGESIVATVDLRPMTQTLGPDDKDDPFKKFDETNDADKAMKKRREDTFGITRNNIEVVPVISVTYRLDANANDGNTRFGYNPKSVENFIRDCITQGANLKDPVWSELPAKMAVDIWREYLRKYKLEELFQVPEGKNENNLQIIGQQINARMKNPEIDALDDVGRPTGEKVKSKEFEILQSMGVKVNNVGIKQVFFSQEVEDKLVNQWTTLWLKNAQKESDQIERNRKLSEERGAEEAKKQFAKDASFEISNEKPTNEAHALEMLVHSTFLGVRRNTALLKRITSELGDLSRIRDWLRQNREAR